MQRKVLLYTIGFALLVTIIWFFNAAYRKLGSYSELTSRNNIVHSNYQNLSGEITNAAVLHPDLLKAGNAAKEHSLFYTDSLRVIRQLDRLRSAVRDSINVQIAAELNKLIRSEISWLLNSNVPDSIIHGKAQQHIVAFRTIDSLINEGIQRTFFIVDYHDKNLHDEINKMKIWVIILILVSGILIIYITTSLFRQRSKTKTKEKELETVLNRISDGVISIDNDWRYTYLNDAALATHPMSKEETLGKLIWDVHPGFKGTIFWDKYYEAILEKKVVEVEDYYAPMESWFSVKIYPSSDGLTIFYKDITKSKKAEEKLTQSLKEVSDYKYSLDESSIIAITDQKGIIKHANENFCKISKYSVEELIGQDHRIINSGHHPKEFIRNLWVTIANGKIWKGELKNKAKDGTIYWVDTTIVPFLDENGKPYQYVAIRADITERKLAEENLQKSLKEITDYKFALDESSIIAITDQKGIIKHANENFCRISKYSLDELIGQDHRIVNSGHHPKEFIRNLWVTIANGKIWKGELKNKAKDGTIYWVDTTIVPFLDDKGKPYQYVAIRADITERKKAEDDLIELNRDLEEKIIHRTLELRKTNEEMEAFSYSVSHDLRAPLRAIIGYAAILDEDYGNKLGADAKEVIDIIKNSTEKMGRLIDDLLDFSRMGKKEIFKTTIDTTLMINEVIKEVTQDKINSRICWDIRPLPEMNADFNTIRQVWINLLSNAIKYSGNNSKPHIEIGSSKENGQTVFYVKDNGAGFDEQYKDKLFKVFQRLHDADEFEGTGVGLALVERIISKHDGKVWAEGKENEGACFYFSLPD